MRITGSRRRRNTSTESPSRRDFLKAGIVGLGSASLASTAPFTAMSLAASKPGRDLTIARIDRTTVRVPFRPAPQRAMDRELPHWRYSEIFEVRLRCGHVGFGENLLYYTWGASSDDDVKRVEGANAADLLWDDSLGAGLQMALFDAVARALDVPVHRLLGHQVHERTPLSWWNIDMAVDDMAAECALARKTGYMSYKTKGRPWFDVWKQVDEAAKVVPPDFKIDMDFNSTLLDAERGIPILKDLEAYPQVDIYESPIPQSDIKGNQAICAATRVNIAMHYGTPQPIIALKENVCDGFVVGGGATRVMEAGAVCAAGDKPLWLQLVGTGITAAFSLHFGAVLSHARWPAVNCHQLYTHSLLTEPIEVRDGFAAIPSGPGLGYELDKDALERFRVDKPTERPDPPRLLKTTWPSGKTMYLANNGEVNFMVRKGGKEGILPFYERGVDTVLVPDDGSDRWKRLYQTSRAKPTIVDE